MRSVTLVAVKRPGWLPSITRPSPELFGLIEATSNAGAGGVACALKRGAFSAPTTQGAARAPRAAVVFRSALHDCGPSVETLIIVTLEIGPRIIRLDAPPAVAAGVSAQPPRRAGGRFSVFNRMFGAIDDEHIGRTFLRIKFQSKLKIVLQLTALVRRSRTLGPPQS